MKKIFLILLLSAFGISTIQAQDAVLENSEAFKQRAAERVALMNSYISYMCNKNKKLDTRKYYKGKALPLFIGKGYDYIENDTRKEGVLMQTTSTRDFSTSEKLTRVYFDRLINLNYSYIKTEFTEIPHMKVSALKKIGDNKYECTVQYVQTFLGYRDGRPVYGDKTEKSIKCYVTREDTEDGVDYIIQLGDVSAVDTRIL